MNLAQERLDWLARNYGGGREPEDYECWLTDAYPYDRHVQNLCFCCGVLRDGHQAPIDGQAYGPYCHDCYWHVWNVCGMFYAGWGDNFDITCPIRHAWRESQPYAWETFIEEGGSQWAGAND